MYTEKQSVFSLRTLLILSHLIFLVCSLFFVLRFVIPISAFDDPYDPTQEYTVSSQAEYASQTGTMNNGSTVQPAVLNRSEQVVTDIEKVEDSTAQNNTNSFLNDIWKSVSNVSSRSLQNMKVSVMHTSKSIIMGLGNVGSIIVKGVVNVGNVIYTAADTIAAKIIEHRAEITLLFLTILASVSMFAFLANPQVIKVALMIIKSILDVYVRLFVGIGVLITATKGGGSLLKRYQSKLESLKKYGWDVGSLQQDGVIFGSIVAMCLVFFGSQFLMSGIKTGTIDLTAMGKQGKQVITYILKETKSAFTETEKECKAREDLCENIWDKGIILASNYLPGTMPDLGVANTVIDLKNQMVTSNAEEQASQ